MQNPVERDFRVKKIEELRVIPDAFLALLEDGELLIAAKHVVTGRLGRYVLGNMVGAGQDASGARASVAELNEQKRALAGMCKVSDQLLMAAIGFGKVKTWRQAMAGHKVLQRGKKAASEDASEGEQSADDNDATDGRGEEEKERNEKKEKLRRRT